MDEFEARFAKLCGARHALAVSSGTAALHLALAGLNLVPGDEVVVPSLTYVASANVVRYLGAEPVFVDVDLDTWCIHPEDIAAAFTERTRGIIAVDLYGYPVDLPAVRSVADAHGIWVLEDAAEAVGAYVDGCHVGHMADVSAFSFYGNKVISCGQGGAVTLDDSDLYQRLKQLRNQARSDSHPYVSHEVGFNYGLSNVSCAILCAQLDKLDKMLGQRRRLVAAYEAALASHPAIGVRPEPAGGGTAPWLTSVTVGDGASPTLRDRLASALDRVGIETRPFFFPLHLLPPYRTSRRADRMDRSLRLSASGISLPTYVGMSMLDVDDVCQRARAFLAGSRPAR